MDILGIITIPNWLIFLLLVLSIIYRYITWQNSTWANRGIPYVKPYPLVGTFYVAATQGLIRGDYQLVKKHGKFFGVYEGHNPALMVSAPDIIKEITVKDAMTHFPDRAKTFNETFDAFTSQSVVVQTGETWKTTRSILTPTFTSNKMRQMLGLIKNAAVPLLEHIDNLAQKREHFECKELFGKFSLDVIASTMFGIEIDSQNNPNSDFVKFANKAFSKANLTNPMFASAIFFPILNPLVKWLGFSFFPKDVISFFRNVSTEILRLRRQGKSSRNDFLQLMINAHRDKLEEEEDHHYGTVNDHESSKVLPPSHKHQGLTDTEILANAVIFFVAGFETTSTAISWFAYIMATKPDIQEAVIAEIEEMVGRDAERVTYESIGKLEYLDKVWCETLRMYPPAERTDRRCTADCELSNGYTIRAGDELVIPIYAIHMDPDNFPNPQKFDPERFSMANRQTRHPYTYLPFGIGPRSCIGMRFAVMEAKYILVRIMQQYRFVKTPDLVENLDPLKHQFSDNGITYVPQGIHLMVAKRDDHSANNAQQQKSYATNMKMAQ